MVFWEHSPMQLFSLLGFMFYCKSSVCLSGFTPCVIFGPLIIFRHSAMKTQILRKVSLHLSLCKSLEKQSKWSETSDLEPFEHQFHLIVIFWFSDGHFPMLPHNKNTDIEHGLICLRHHQLMTVETLENNDSGFGVPSQ